MLPREDDKDPNMKVEIFTDKNLLYSTFKLKVKNLSDLCQRLKDSLPRNGAVKCTPIGGTSIPVL